MKDRNKFTFVRLLLSLVFVTGLLPFGQTPVQASTPAGTIAYVVSHQADGDEIRLVEPDGSNNRLVYATNRTIPDILSDIGTVVWKPDASELAFVGAQEPTCSVYGTDIYAVRPDGSDFRRVTDPPACGSRAGLPTGTVTVPFVNVSSTPGPYLIYFEGATGAQDVFIQPGESKDVTFENVADYGDVKQTAVWILASAEGAGTRYSYPGADVDVLPGQTVKTGQLKPVFGTSDFGFLFPSYLPDGSKIATIFSRNELYQFDTNNRPLGWNGTKVEHNFQMSGSGLVWGPTAAKANQFLYYGTWNDTSYTIHNSIFLGDVNNTEGQMLIDIDPNSEGNVLLGLTWLPDGSGFLYSKKQFIYLNPDNWLDGWFQGADIWEYSFATQQSTQLTHVKAGFTRWIAVSPDGSKIVYEYQATGDWIDANPPTDLRMMNRDGSEDTLFVQGGRTPAWSPAAIPALKPVPTLTAINPTSANAGGAAFTLTATGSNFVNGSVVRWNGAALTTTFVNATTLTAQVTADKIAAAGTAAVTVFTPAPGGGESAPKTLTINGTTQGNPVPVLTSIDPAVVDAGGATFTLTVKGSNFINGTVVRWDGADLPTTFVSATSLTAQVTADKIAATGPVSVTAFTPAPGGGTSNALTLSIVNPQPVLTSLSPSSAVAGGAAFTLTVSGSKFIPGSVIRWNATDLTTTYVNATTLTAQITADKIATAGTAAVTVSNGSPGGGESAPKTFSINNPGTNNPVPVLSGLNPSSAVAGGAGFTLAVSGSNFVSSSVVRWNGAALTTTFVDAAHLTAQVPALKIASAGTASVTVYSPAPGGGVSGAKSFTISTTSTTNPVPVLSNMSKSSIIAGGAGFTLSVYGSNFVSSSVVRWNGAAIATTFVNATTLTAQISSDKFATAGTASVTVFNPAPGGGESGSKTITINNPYPVVTGLTPSSLVVGGADFTLTITGTGFVSTSVARWNKIDLPTTYVNATTLTAQVSAAQIASAGAVYVTVLNPAPGGGESAGRRLIINNPLPVLASLNPSSAVAGQADFTLKVGGSNFVNGSVVRWNGTNLVTTFIDANHLTAQVPAAKVASAGKVTVAIFNPAPAGGSSGFMSFIISAAATNNPVPALSSLTPTSINAGGSGFTLTVKGSNFVSASVVRWNGIDLVTTFVNATTLTAQVPANLVPSGGTVVVKVFTPAPGGGESVALTFTINRGSQTTYLPLVVH